MVHIIVDLEMNHMNPEDPAKKQCSMETIQIGAVMLDSELNEVSSFITYVCPQHNEMISDSVYNLTGITYDDVKDAPVFEVAMHDFAAWCLTAGKKFKIHAWSGADYGQVSHEMKLKKFVPEGDEVRVFQEWKDFQRAFGRKFGYNRPLALKDALEIAGIDFEGRMHTALDDARNTAELYRKYMEEA